MKRNDKERCAVRVNLAAIRANFAGLKALAPGKKICSVIKADAYGHGAIKAAGILDEGTDVFAVATIDEGVELRTGGRVTKPILLLGPNFAGQDEEAVRYGLTETVFEAGRARELGDTAKKFFARQDAASGDGAAAGMKAAAGGLSGSDSASSQGTVIDAAGPRGAAQGKSAGAGKGAGNAKETGRGAAAGALDRAGQVKVQAAWEDPVGTRYAFPDRKAHVHIAVDTGMSRIGLTPDLMGVRTIRDIMSNKNICIDGIFTHFATADETDKAGALKALERFRSFKELCTANGVVIPVWHAANTASVIDGIALGDEMDMVRLGIGLYGMYPSSEVMKERVRLYRPMEWYAHVTFVKDIEAGTSVSYGYEFTAGEPMRIATICCGYADGYPRLLSGRGAVLVHGRRCPILGRVCMDQFMVDVTGIECVKAGDRAVLMGRDGDEEITPEEIAGLTGTINYEVTCDISARVPRVYMIKPVQLAAKGQ